MTTVKIHIGQTTAKFADESDAKNSFDTLKVYLRILTMDFPFSPKNTIFWGVVGSLEKTFSF